MNQNVIPLPEKDFFDTMAENWWGEHYLGTILPKGLSHFFSLEVVKLTQWK